MQKRRKQLLLIGLPFLTIVLVGGTVMGILLYRWYTPNGTSSIPAGSTSVPLPSPTWTVEPVTLVPEVSQTPESTPTAEPTPTLQEITYVVQSGDTLWGISLQFNVTVDQIKQANGLTSDTISVGQTIVIPSGAGDETSENYHVVAEGETIQSIAAANDLSTEDLRAANYMYGDALLPGQKLFLPQVTPVPAPAYLFSTLEGDLSVAYPLTFSQDQFTVHYAPNTFTARDPQAVADMVTRSITHIQSLYQVPLSGTFDVYIAGTLFESPNHHLRGLSQSVNRRSFFLHDGTGNAIDQQYISAHELTHLYSWNTFGQPSSTMVSEGAAVYSGMEIISGSDYLPLDTFCAAYLQEGVLPSVSSALSFQGHINDLQNYYAAGCFVGYLVDTYGPQTFGQVYSSGNWLGVYGNTLYGLEQDWRASLATVSIPDGFDSRRLVNEVSAVEQAYKGFLPGFSPTQTQLNAYYELDQARLALMRADFDAVDSHLTAFNQILNP